MSETIYLERPWRRLLWELPAALLITGLALATFTKFLEAPAPPKAEQKPVTARIIELPPTPKPATLPAPTPPAPAAPQTSHVEHRAPPPKDVVPPKPEVMQPAPEKPIARPRIRPVPQDAPAKPAHMERATPRPRTVTPPPDPAEAKPSQSQSLSEPAHQTSSLPGGGSMGARVIYKAMPEIPSDLLGQDINTSAMARFQVAADGTAQVDLVHPTDDPRLNQAILEALQRWRFFPAMQDGKPVGSTVILSIPIRVQ